MPAPIPWLDAVTIATLLVTIQVPDERATESEAGGSYSDCDLRL